MEKDLSGKKKPLHLAGGRTEAFTMPPKNWLLEGGRMQALLRVMGKLVKEGSFGKH